MSAKADSNWEMIWKLIKRNKGASAGAASAVVVLLTSLVFLFQAWQKTEAANTALAKKQTEKEQAEKEKREQLIQSVPTMLEAARYFINARKFATAADQVRMALGYNPSNADAHLLLAQLLMGEKKFDAAQIELGECLSLSPQHSEARAFADLLKRVKPDDTWILFELSDELQRKQLNGLAAHILESAGALVEARKKLVPLYRKKIEETWPGLGERLTIDDKGSIDLNLQDAGKLVATLMPLKGMKINSLNLAGCSNVDSLAPLQGMPLVSLGMSNLRRINNLTQLQNMSLTFLDLTGLNELEDLTPLRGMPPCARQASWHPARAAPRPS